MKILNFNYTKKSGEESERNVLVMTENKEYIDALDFNYLSAKEQEEVKELYQEYESKLKPFLEKSFRRFSKDGIENVQKQSS